MKTQQIPYDEKKHYDGVYQMLTEAFPMTGPYVQWMPPRWEYMHYHPNLTRAELSKIGIWIEDDRIVGVTTYEDNLGDAYVATLPTHRWLLEEMVQYAQRTLYKKQHNGNGSLRIFCSDCDQELETILKKNNFKMDPTKKSAYIEPVATDPDYRRMGLAKAAVLACIRECKERGMERVIVESAQPFYVSMGFKKIFSMFPWTKHIALCKHQLHHRRGQSPLLWFQLGNILASICRLYLFAFC